jgi:hypothetical protein
MTGYRAARVLLCAAGVVGVIRLGQALGERQVRERVAY